MNPFLTKSFPATVNGDNVIAFTDAKNYKTSLVEHNLGSLASWYYEDPDKNHLGLLNLFSNIANYPVPMYMGMINNGATISVNGIELLSVMIYLLQRHSLSLRLRILQVII